MKINDVLKKLNFILIIDSTDIDIPFIDEEKINDLISDTCNKKYGNILEKVNRYHTTERIYCSLCGKKLYTGLSVGKYILCSACNTRENNNLLFEIQSVYDFAKTISEESKPLDGELQKILNDNFEELW